MSSYKTLPTPGDTAWFTHDRFGMFIHFGLYAMPARHEWVKNYEEIPEDHYDLYFKHFIRICTTRRNGQDRQKRQA